MISSLHAEYIKTDIFLCLVENKMSQKKEDVIFDTKTKTKITLPMLANRKYYKGTILNGDYYVDNPGYSIYHFSFSNTKDNVSNGKHVCVLRMTYNPIK